MDKCLITQIDIDFSELHVTVHTYAINIYSVNSFALHFS